MSNDGHNSEYVEGRSYLFDDIDAQELVDRYHIIVGLERTLFRLKA